MVQGNVLLLVVYVLKLHVVSVWYDTCGNVLITMLYFEKYSIIICGSVLIPHQISLKYCSVL